MSTSNKTIISIIILRLMCMVRAGCDNPPSLANAVSNITGSPPFTAGIRIRFDCSIGYNPTGTSRFYKCSNTEWIGGPFQCEKIYCSRIERPENGRIINQPTNEVGTVIKFACSEGYDMSSSDSMLCRADSNWSPASPPTCTAKDCGEFGSIQYASVFQDSSNAERNHFGSVVEVKCLDGRVLNGPPRVECKANGQWGERPTCEFLQCPPYPNANTSCVYKSTLQGDFYYIMCKTDMSTKTGPDIVQCINGEWDSLEMACYCDCSIPKFNTDVIRVDGLNSYGNVPHNATLEWTCQHGHSSFQVDYVVCVDGNLRAIKNEEEVRSLNTLTSSVINPYVLLSLLCHVQKPWIEPTRDLVSKPSNNYETPQDHSLTTWVERTKESVSKPANNSAAPPDHSSRAWAEPSKESVSKPANNSETPPDHSSTAWAEPSKESVSKPANNSETPPDHSSTAWAEPSKESVSKPANNSDTPPDHSSTAWAEPSKESVSKPANNSETPPDHSSTAWAEPSKESVSKPANNSETPPDHSITHLAESTRDSMSKRMKSSVTQTNHLPTTWALPTRDSMSSPKKDSEMPPINLSTHLAEPTRDSLSKQEQNSVTPLERLSTIWAEPTRYLLSKPKKSTVNRSEHLPTTWASENTVTQPESKRKKHNLNSGTNLLSINVVHWRYFLMMYIAKYFY